MFSCNPSVIGGKNRAEGEALSLRCGTGVPACRSTPRDAGRAGRPWNLMGRMPMPRHAATRPISSSSLRLCAFALRLSCPCLGLCPGVAGLAPFLLLLPPSPCTPESEALRSLHKKGTSAPLQNDVLGDRSALDYPRGPADKVASCYRQRAKKSRRRCDRVWLRMSGGRPATASRMPVLRAGRDERGGPDEFWCHGVYRRHLVPPLAASRGHLAHVLTSSRRARRPPHSPALAGRRYRLPRPLKRSRGVAIRACLHNRGTSGRFSSISSASPFPGCCPATGGASAGLLDQRIHPDTATEIQPHPCDRMRHYLRPDGSGELVAG